MKRSAAHPDVFGDIPPRANLPRWIPATLALGFAVAVIGTAVNANAQGLPPSQPRNVCELPYTLAPGERRVLLCDTNPRASGRGQFLIESRHDSVDATVIERLPLGRVIVALTNRSDVEITATARGESW
jgi:hypothetical protein